jgi:Kef-type K+ transport system membrane component KefB
MTAFRAISRLTGAVRFPTCDTNTGNQRTRLPFRQAQGTKSMSTATIEGLLWIIVAATLAPIIADIIPRVTVPVVVLEILLGILLGPTLLDLIHHSTGLEVAKEFGVIFLFFLAGFEVDYAGIKGNPLRSAFKGWVFSLFLALILCFALQQMGLISSFYLVAIAICTTALGPLMPILNDSGQLPTPFGSNVLSIGALGEFVPVFVVVSVAIFPLIAFTGMEKPGKRVNGNGEEEKVIESLPEIAITTNGK